MLSQDVERHITLQRALGFKFGQQSRNLRQFASYAEAHGDEFVHTERVLAWVARTDSARMRHSLVSLVRRFAIAMQAEDPRHEVPPRDCVRRYKIVRRVPYIYSADDIARLMQAADQLPGDRLIAPKTFRTLLGLLASTGLRISEAITLQCSDVGEDSLLVRHSKHGKSRILPLHETTRSALEAYLSERVLRPAYTQALFVYTSGHPLNYETVWTTFRGLTERVGLRPVSTAIGPRLHDLRHTFAVRSLEQCRHDKAAVAHHMAALSHYLGHTNVTDTYWYLETTPILMGKIAQAGEAMHRGDGA